MIKHIADRPGHDVRYAVNSSKLQNELGWKPSSDFRNLTKTVEWFLRGCFGKILLIQIEAFKLMFFSALNFKIIWRLLSSRRKRQLFFLVILMILGSFSEAASLGALLPFIWYLSGDFDNLGGFFIINQWVGGEFGLNQNFWHIYLNFSFFECFSNC